MAKFIPMVNYTASKRMAIAEEILGLSFVGSPAAGAFGCWKRDIKQTWCERDGSLSQAELQRVRQRWQEAESKFKTETLVRQKKARQVATWVFARAKPVTSHAYLEAKQVQSHSELRQYRGALLLPLRDLNGELHTLQFIGANGKKDFSPAGRSPAVSLHWPTKRADRWRFVKGTLPEPASMRRLGTQCFAL
jgi:phage/plasmid primase-like uncharacterized protein